MSSPPSGPPRVGKKQGLLLRVERFSRQNYLAVFVLALLFIATGGYLGSRLDLESNILNLIPKGNRQVDTFRLAMSEFGSIDYLLVLLETPDGQSPDALEEFADLFADHLREKPELVEVVDYRFELDADFLELFYANALLFLSPERLNELALRLTDEAIINRLQEVRLELASPTASFTHDLLQNDPLNLMPLFVNRLLGNRGTMQLDLTTGYYLSRDHASLIMLVKPTHPSQDLEFDRRLLDTVREAEGATRQLLSEDLGRESPVGVRYGGNYAVAVDESSHIKKDVKFNLFFSLFAVSSLYWLCYRRFAALLYSSLPLLVGQAMTFGLCFFVLGGLNASSAAFTALLMGLGTDFVIVIYARYIEERRKGRTLAEATELMIGETGLGVFTGAITSAGTFFALCISQFRALWDLGFLIGFGILLCALAILFMLPAMIKWNEGVRRRKVDSVTKLHLQSFYVERLIVLSARYPAATIVLVVALTGIGGYLATQLDFDDTVSVLRSNRSESFKVQQEIAERFGASLSYMMAITEADSRDEALRLAETIEERLQPFVEQGTVASYDSILNYLPPESQQQQVLQALRDDTDGRFDRQRIRTAFLRGLDENGLSRAGFSGFLERMELFLSPERPIRLDDLERQGLERVIERYVNADGTRVMTYLFLADKRWKREPPPGLVQALSGTDEGIIVTGTNVLGVEFRRIFSREAPQAVGVGLVIVFILLWVDFRSLRLTAIALSQLICGVILMLGGMKIAGIHLNYVNAFVATMILGVGIDYSIHLVHRLNMSGGIIDDGLLETGKAVVMASLTNIAGFGTLILGNYPALRSFGTVALFGSVACLFTALTLVPALMAKSGSTEPSGRA